MAGVGADWELLPVSRSYLTWGQFSPPSEVTDLLAGWGNSEMYHWNDVAG